MKNNVSVLLSSNPKLFSDDTWDRHQIEVVGGLERSKTAIKVVFPGVGSETRLYLSSMYAFYMQLMGACDPFPILLSMMHGRTVLHGMPYIL